MKINKAVITAAAPAQPRLPLQLLVDQNGHNKSALTLIVEEAVNAGVEEICLIVREGDQDTYLESVEEHQSRINIIEQSNPTGYGDALLRAKDFVAGDAFLHLIGDHIYVSNQVQSCAAQLIEVATREECTVTAVEATRETMLPYFGTIGANRLPQQKDLYEVKRVIEKPTPTIAEQELSVAGLRAGFYLCIFGMHVLMPGFMTVLEKSVAEDPARHISDALNVLASQERYLACEVNGSRYNIGLKYGILKAQLELALSGPDRDFILSELVETLAQRVSKSSELDR